MFPFLQRNAINSYRNYGNANILLVSMLLVGVLGLGVGVVAFKGLPDTDLTWRGVLAQVQSQLAQWTRRLPGLGKSIYDKPIYSLAPGQSVEDIQKMYMAQRALGDEVVANAEIVHQGGQVANGSTDPMPVIDKLTQLRERMPGLEDVLLYRIAELYSAVPSEWQAQRHLTRLIETYPDSALIPAAQYRLAESYFRSKETESAGQWFRQVKSAYPSSQYAVGALYYLGELALLQEKSPNGPWLEYLSATPNGRFSPYIASYLAEHPDGLDAQHHKVLGEALVESGEYEKALPHLLHVAPSEVWPALAKVYFKLNLPDKALTLLQNQIHLANSDASTEQQVADAIEMTFRTGPRAKVVTWAKNMVGGKPFVRKDAMYWWLSQVEALSAKQYYQGLVQHYPKSVYAPASQLALIWPQLMAAIPGQGNPQLMNQLEDYLKQYGYSQAAPTAAFWLAKFHEAQGHSEEAVQRYRQVVRDYPYHYYGFRSAGRLQVLLHDKADPYWTVTPSATYPDADGILANIMASRQEALMQLPEWEGLPGGVQQQLAALVAMPSKAAMADMMLILTEALPRDLEEPSAMIISWQDEADGNYPKALRSVRDNLAELARQGDMQGFQPTTAQLKQMYPVPHWSVMQVRAKANGLDPFLSQALMREESYFNPKAVSSSNALGLMQLLPATAREVAGWEDLSGFSDSDLFIPETNIQLGTRYLRYLTSRFEGKPYASMLIVGSYNGGPNAMAGWVGDAALLQRDPDAFVERIPYEQTRDYIKKVYTSYWLYRMLYAPRSVG